MWGLTMDGGALPHHPINRHRVLVLQLCRRLLERGRGVRVHDRLGQAVAVPQVEELDPSVVAHAVHPAVQGDGPADIGRTELAAGGGAFHGFHGGALYHH